MTENSNQRILGQYDERVDLYRGLTSKAKSLVEEMLREEGIRIHSVTSRVKMRESLREKIARSDKNYSELSDVTDIAGVRVITYFDDDVDRVAECLEREFVGDWENSIDRRAALDPDRFGYLSLHYIAELRACADRSWSARRSGLPTVAAPCFPDQSPHNDDHLREGHPEIDHPPPTLRTPHQLLLVGVVPRNSSSPLPTDWWPRTVSACFSWRSPRAAAPDPPGARRVRSES